MKKILFTVVFSTLFIGLSAQNILVDRPSAYSSGFNSTNPVDSPMILCADFFELTEEVALGELTIYGEYINGYDPDLEIAGLSIFIYENVGVLPSGRPDEPGTGIVELPFISQEFLTIEDDPSGPGDNRIITVSFTEANDGNQLIMEPGLYWMAVAPVIQNPVGDFPNANIWYWGISAVTAPIAPVFIDPSDIGGVGATDWTNIGDLIPGFPAFAWSLTDEEVEMSTIENIIDNLIVYPNPVKDVLSINSKAGEVKNIALYDLTGKELKADFNGQSINMSALPAGVYMLKIATEKGVITKKVIKK